MNKRNKNHLAIIAEVEKKFKKTNIPSIEVGDSIEIKLIIQEGNKERIQNSEGVVISKNNAQLNTTITIRKTVQNIGIEKVYLIHSPRIINIKIISQAKVRRSKLYYLRNRSGKATKLKPRLT
uniref:Large ribosomal subunit protein bL19c n=1 Tax=Acrosorium ciliolatum TaxID=1550622 RepID=A0A1Z1M220_9FLOR|nr:ribosomal protein L19 [Acrosorium ciliolatum]ARW60076.1 ribosomal protein L19 [Acrosorium ciliolatum]